MKKTVIGFLAFAFILVITSPAYSGVGFGGAFRDNKGTTITAMDEMQNRMCSGQLTPETQKEMCVMMKDMCGTMTPKKVNPEESNFEHGGHHHSQN